MIKIRPHSTFPPKEDMSFQYVIIYHVTETIQEIICESCMAGTNKQLVSVRYLSVQRWRLVKTSKVYKNVLSRPDRERIETGQSIGF